MSYQSNFSDILTNEETQFLYHQVGDFGANLENFTAIISADTFQNVEETAYDPNLHMKYEAPAEMPLPPATPMPILQWSPQVLSTDDYPGPYTFEVSVIPDGTKNPWVYSVSLNKIFIDMAANFPVDFRINNNLDRNDALFIRVTPIFSQSQHAQDLVFRCLQHEQPTPGDLNDPSRQHIIKCNNVNTEYIGDKNQSRRLSCVFPLGLPQTGSDSVRELFKFMCKNSCPTPGMNRKSIQVIFTLEDKMATILGRKVLNVRVCSCPKRDKEKEEREFNTGTKPSKKRKIVKQEQTSTKLNININVVGKDNMKKIMVYAQDLMKAELHKKGPNQAETNQCLSEITTLLNREH